MLPNMSHDILNPIIMGLEHIMATCVPIKELKDTAGFADLVAKSDGEVVVTKNGTEAFAAISIPNLEALKLEAARAELYRMISQAEDDIGAGRLVDATTSQENIRERYGL